MLLNALSAHSRHLLGLALGLLLLCLLVPVVGAQGANAMVRVAHASPDAPPVDIYVNGNRALSNVPFGTISNYLSVPAGRAALKVVPAGAAADTRGVIEAEVNLEGGRAYTVAATGRLANIGPAVLSDNLAAPAAGKAKVRLVHASPDAPAVDVAVKGGPVILSNTAFRAASNYVEVDAGTYDLEVRPAGQSAVALAVPGVRLEAGVTYSVFALGQLQGQPALRAQPVVDARATAGAPGMPRTGAGSLTTGDDSTLLLLAVAGGLGGLVLAWRRRTRRAA